MATRHYYVCDRCHSPLTRENGSFYKGERLCERCRAIAQIEEENGKYDFTGAGMPYKGV